MGVKLKCTEGLFSHTLQTFVGKALLAIEADNPEHRPLTSWRLSYIIGTNPAQMREVIATLLANRLVIKHILKKRKRYFTTYITTQKGVELMKLIQKQQEILL